MWCCAHLYKKIQKIIRILKYWYVTVFNLHKISLWIVLQIYFITSLSCCFCGFYFFLGRGGLFVWLFVVGFFFGVCFFMCIFSSFYYFYFYFFAFFRFNLLLSMQFLFKHFFPCTILVLSIWFHNVILILFIERGQK